MPDVPASNESLSEERLQDPVPWFRRQASALFGTGLVEDKAVRFGSLEPAHVTLAKQSILPFIVVLVLSFSLVLSRLSEQNKRLAQHVALLMRRLDDLEQERGEE